MGAGTQRGRGEGAVAVYGEGCSGEAGAALPRKTIVARYYSSGPITTPLSRAYICADSYRAWRRAMLETLEDRSAVLER